MQVYSDSLSFDNSKNMQPKRKKNPIAAVT
jgi:hypothetical protein